MKFFCSLVALASALMLAPPAFATIFDFHADLVGSNEVPPNASHAIGVADFTLDTVAGTLSVTEGFAGLTSPASAAHIHCCAVAGTNASVVLTFSSADLFPIGETSGSFSHTYDLATSLTGISAADFIGGLEAGDAYTDIHTTTFPSGEIRGQILSPAVPEPSTWAMLLIGFAGIGFAAYRRKTVALC
jgi:hypothetical protein